MQHEVDQTELLVDKMMSNSICKSLIRGENVEYEVPGIAEIFGNQWKGKADIINHDEKLIIDLKTTADISKFKYSASKYNYNSQAYIYQKTCRLSARRHDHGPSRHPLDSRSSGCAYDLHGCEKSN